MKRKGFTLIELLVVIAIIGILAAMVIVALNTARKKSADSRIKGDIASLRRDAETYANENGNKYTSWCLNTTTNFKALASDIERQGAINDFTDGFGNCGANAESFAVRSKLKTDATYYVCVDNRGATYGGAVTIGLSGGKYVCSSGTRL